MTPDQSDAILPDARQNRPTTFAHRAEFLATRALHGFFKLIGVDAASFIAGKFMRLVGPLIKKPTQRARRNLEMVFPDWNAQQYQQTIRDAYENLGRTVGEFPHLDQFVPLPSKRLSVEGRDKLINIGNGDQPVVFVAGHFGNWELCSLSAFHSGVDHAIVYRAANNPLVDKFIIDERAKSGTSRQIPKSRAGLRPMVSMLKKRRSIAMLVDQKLNQGIDVPLLGHMAKTAPAAAGLSLLMKAPIVPGTLKRLHGAHFQLTIHDPIAFTPTGDKDADIWALTKLINDQISKDVRDNPGQWLWFHRRWPTS